MNAIRQHALQIESEFLAGVQGNLAQFADRFLRGSWFQRTERDQADVVRAALIDRGHFDRDLLRQLPLGRAMVLRGFERRWFFGRRETSMTIATVLSPPGPLLDGEESPPLTLAEVASHVRSLVGHTRTPTVVAVCSPSGFQPEVWNSRLELPGVKVILSAPKPPGEGWRVHSISSNVDERLVRLFDPEAITDKLRRIRNEIEERGGDLLMGGISARSISERLELSPRLVDQTLELMSRADPELRVSRVSGELLLFRGAPVDALQEDRSMSVTEWLRSLFSRKGDEAKKINALSERRAALAQRRDRLYEDISRLETKEAALTQEGKQNQSAVVRRRLAAQISQIRKDISRVNTTAAMLNQQINVISTHIHNLTLIQQGTLAKLPEAEELTEDAVRAEEMLETLRADAELVSGLETGVADVMMTSDEAEILKEFEAADAARVAAAQPATTPVAVTEPPKRESQRAERAGPAAE